MNVNRHGADWKELKKFLTETIESNQRSMEEVLSEPDLNIARGQIRLARVIIKKVEPPEAPELEDENYG